MTVNPIVDWSDDDVWDYMHSEHLPVNPLYCEGQKRVGCIGCPMAGRGGADSGSLLVGLLMKKCTSKRLTGCSKYEKTKGFKTHLFGTELKLAKKCSTGGWKMAFFPVS